MAYRSNPDYSWVILPILVVLVLVGYTFTMFKLYAHERAADPMYYEIRKIAQPCEDLYPDDRAAFITCVDEGFARND